MDNPCWPGYEAYGLKRKGGRTVPNCVPKKPDPPKEMPYKLKEVPGGWVVVTEGTGRHHSLHPLSKEMAKKQMAALYVHVKDAKKDRKK